MMRNCRSRSAFTLVELLVVIAIITVLASLLMPALRQAVESARGVACMSNIKQTSLFIGIYAEDYGGWRPGSDLYVDGHGKSWTWYFQDQPAKVLRCVKNTGGCYGIYGPKPRYCSEDGDFMSTLNIDGIKRFYRFARMTRPAEFLYLSDTSGGDGTGSNVPLTYGSSGFSGSIGSNGVYLNKIAVWLAHNDTSNGVFADGHAETCDPGQLLEVRNGYKLYKGVLTYGIHGWKLSDGSEISMPW
ncbi:MAG: type II secretion system protein [Planctomycetes bacterium]|nr:type II secretion system protein [Planctomycetota bacterium]